jgi:hypothetical protein
MASSNPSNFANLPKDELKEIAAKGGHASHGSGNNEVRLRRVLLLSEAQHLTNFRSRLQPPPAAAAQLIATPMAPSPKAPTSLLS